MKIQFFAALSMDGFYMPLDMQQLCGFNSSEYESLYQDADVILINRSEYKNFQKRKIDFKKPIYVISKGMLLTSQNCLEENKYLTVQQLKREVNGNISVIVNIPKLINRFLHENLIDEMVICIFPVLLGKGKRLFPTLSDKMIWKVKKYQFFGSGTTTVCYQRV